MLPVLALLAGLAAADPITPPQLDEALQAPLSDAEADALADRIRAAFPGRDLKEGGHLVEGELVAFVIDAPGAEAPRVEGMVNHSRGLDLVPVGRTGLWARVEPIPTDTKFAYNFRVGRRRVGGAAVEMPDWSYPPESSEQPGRKYGEYKPLKFRSAIFDNDRTGWVYVPAAYDGSEPAALMVFQDGDAYKGEHVGTVVDNLIADGKMPVTILVLLNPGTNDDGRSNRSVEYDSLDDRYVRFLDEEALPPIRAEYKLKGDAADHAIGGASSGGICAFNAAWHRPDLFGKVLSQIGSFTNIRGGDAYPRIVREAEPKPIQVVLTDGTNDLINRFGDWWQANEAMDAALKEKGYDVTFLRDRGFHAFWTCGRQLPEAMPALWGTGSGGDHSG